MFSASKFCLFHIFHIFHIFRGLKIPFRHAENGGLTADNSWLYGETSYQSYQLQNSNSLYNTETESVLITSCIDGAYQATLYQTYSSQFAVNDSSSTDIVTKTGTYSETLAVQWNYTNAGWTITAVTGSGTYESLWHSDTSAVWHQRTTVFAGTESSSSGHTASLSSTTRQEELLAEYQIAAHWTDTAFSLVNHRTGYQLSEGHNHTDNDHHCTSCNENAPGRQISDTVLYNNFSQYTETVQQSGFGKNSTALPTGVTVRYGGLSGSISGSISGTVSLDALLFKREASRLSAPGFSVTVTKPLGENSTVQKTVSVSHSGITADYAKGITGPEAENVTITLSDDAEVTLTEISGGFLLIVTEEAYAEGEAGAEGGSDSSTSGTEPPPPVVSDTNPKVGKNKGIGGTESPSIIGEFFRGMYSGVHNALDIAGFLPFAGELADGANSLLYLAEGDKVSAVTSAAAMVPLAGWTATGGKWLKKGADAIPAAKLTENAAKGANKAEALANTVPLRKNLLDAGINPLPGMTNPQAHHDLPQKFKNQFTAAGLDINDAQYGRWVDGGPTGNHQKWSAAFNKQWDEFFQDNPGASKEQILNKMNALRNDPAYQ